jgi:hypothetical protein
MFGHCLTRDGSLWNPDCALQNITDSVNGSMIQLLVLRIIWVSTVNTYRNYEGTQPCRQVRNVLTNITHCYPYKCSSMIVNHLEYLEYIMLVLQEQFNTLIGKWMSVISYCRIWYSSCVHSVRSCIRNIMYVRMPWRSYQIKKSMWLTDNDPNVQYQRLILC